MSDLIKRIDKELEIFPLTSHFGKLINDCKAALSAVDEPVGMKMTQEMFHKTDGKAGAFLWWKDVPYGAKLYTAPPSVDALIAEIDELCFDEASGGYFWPESIHPSVIKEILDKYRSAK